jgi:hypothetical protein
VATATTELTTTTAPPEPPTVLLDAGDARPHGYTVVTTQDDFTYLADLESGQVRPLEVPEAAGADALVAVWTGFVATGGGDAVFASLPGGQPPVSLGAATEVLPADLAGVVWLVRSSTAGVRVQLVAMDGRALGEPVVFAVGARVVGVLDGGLAVARAGGTVVVERDTGLHAEVAEGEAVAAGGGHLVMEVCDGSRCSVHLNDLQTGSDTVVVPDPGKPIHGLGASFSPDGSSLLVWYNAGGALTTVLVDVDTAAVRPAPELHGPTWSPDSEWTFFARDDLLWAWNPPSDKPVTVLDLGAFAAGAYTVVTTPPS